MSLENALVIGLVLSAAIGWIGFRRGSLSASGVGGAVLTGTIVFAFGGWVWAGLLVAFFVSSSSLSHFRAQAKREYESVFQKGSRRDLAQTLANGGLAALLAVAHYFSPHPALAAAFVGALAAVNADTWATELGVLSPTPPRLITTGREVARGTSGGITLLGTAAGFLGATFIGVVAFILHLSTAAIGIGPFPGEAVWLPLLAAVGGLAGSLVDSFLGATVQGIYYCERCGRETERAIHHCGQVTQRIRGLRWFDNDVVNLTASAVGALKAVGLWWVLAQSL